MDKAHVSEDNANLIVASRIEGPWAVVDVEGEVDLFTAPRLREAVYGLTDQGHLRVVLNLRDLRFMDSTGLGVLVGVLKRLRDNDGTLVLAEPQHSVQRILSITGLDDLFPTQPTVEAALSQAAE